MIHIKNVRTLKGRVEDLFIEAQENSIIEAEGRLTALPALILSHVNFGENWKDLAKEAVSGGITTVFDTIAPTSLVELREKKNWIQSQLAGVNIPLQYRLHLNIHRFYEADITLVKSEIAAIYIPYNLENKERLFQLAAQNDIMISASGNVEQVIALAEKYGSSLYLHDIGTEEELMHIQKAKNKQLLVYAQTSPLHLFQEEPYSKIVFQAIHDRLIDSIGSQREIKFLLPLLVNAVNDGKLTLEQIVQLTRINLEDIYRIERNKDLVLVDMNLEREMAPHKTLKGWPIYTIIKGQIHKLT